MKVKKRKSDILLFKLVKVAVNINKNLIPASILYVVNRTITPYILLIYSAKIIDCLVDNTYTLAIQNVVLMCFLTLLSKCVDSIVKCLEKKWEIIINGSMRSQMNTVCYDVEYEQFGSYQFQTDYQGAHDGLEYSGGEYAFIKSCMNAISDVLRIFVAFYFIVTLFGQMESWFGKLMLLVLIVLVFACSILRIKFNTKSFEAASQFYQNLVPYNNQLQYFFYNLCAEKGIGKDIRVYHLEDVICEREDTCHKDVLYFLKNIANISAKFDSLNAMLDGFVSGSTYLLIGLCCVIEGLGIGTVLKYVGIVNQISQSVADLLNISADIKFKSQFLGNYLTFVNKYLMKENEAKTSLIANGAHIACDNISFTYEGAERAAVSEVSLEIPSGAQVAIVGENGSGKTTLLHILMGLYKPQKGVVNVAGEQLRNVSTHIAPVFQDYKVFPITVLQNITFASTSSEADEKKAWRTLELLELKERVERLPERINTALQWSESNQSVGLSGGEEQKLVLSRALFSERPIMVLDEPSAAMDPMSEIRLYELFQKITNDKTVIYVSHRLFSCRKCDKIFVMDKGKLIQEGTHEQLVNQEGKYKEMWDAQTKELRTIGI